MAAACRPSSYHDVVDEPLLRITQRDLWTARARAILFPMLDQGAAIEPLRALSRFTLFAALRRYDESPDQEELDRAAWNQRRARLRDHVASLLP